MRIMASALAAVSWLSCALASATSDAKVAKFSALATKGGGVIKLDSRSFDELVATPRDYSVSIVLTALAPQFKCAPCRVFDGELRLLARSWAKQRDSQQHFFASLDFPDGQDIFRRLNLQTAPHVKFYHPTEGSRATAKEPATYDINRAGPSAEAFVGFVRQNSGLSIPFSRPPNYAVIGTSIGAVAVVSTLLYVFRGFVYVVVTGRVIWAFGTIFSVLLFTSGHMWNQIRTPPFVGAGPGGSPAMIASGFQSQYGIETNIIMVMYGVLAFSFYTLAVTVPSIKDPARQRLAGYTWTGILVVATSALTGIFRAKQPGYPFWFLFK